MTLEQVLTILTPAMPFLLALAAALYQGLLQRLPSAQSSQLSAVVSTVVSGVEQASSVSGMTSDAKKAAATKAVTEIAQVVGLGKFATPTMIDLAIEAAVFALNASQPVTAASVAPTTPAQPLPAL